MAKKLKFIIILCFLCFQPVVLAQEKQDFNVFQLRPKVQSDLNNEVKSQTDNNGQGTSTEQPVPASGNNESNPVNNSVQPEKIKAKEQLSPIPTNKQNNNLLNSINSGLAKLNPATQKINESEKKPEPKMIHIRLFNKEIAVRRLHMTTILAVLGLLGTFLGICSTWTIYLLTRKNNDPLIRDRKECALRYIEELYKIKDCFISDKLKRLDLLLDNILIGNLSQAESYELANLISIYNKCASLISKISMEEVHNRYKKHIKKNKADFFSSLIAHYRMIEIDARNCGGSCYNPDSADFLAEENIIQWKNKVVTMLSFEKKVLTTLKILNRELKR